MGDSLPYGVPWTRPELWQAANHTIEATLGRYRDAARPLAELARSIRNRIQTLEGDMDDLGRHTCSRCRSICCRHARAYYDFRDLIYIHLSRTTVPKHQTLGKKHPVCRYLAPQGCRLRRVQRPFICTWYLCPDQQACLANLAVSKARFIRNSLEAVINPAIIGA